MTTRLIPGLGKRDTRELLEELERPFPTGLRMRDADRYLVPGIPQTPGAYLVQEEGESLEDFKDRVISSFRALQQEVEKEQEKETPPPA